MCRPETPGSLQRVLHYITFPSPCPYFPSPFPFLSLSPSPHPLPSLHPQRPFVGDKPLLLLFWALSAVNLCKGPILRYLCSQRDPSRSFILPL